MRLSLIVGLSACIVLTACGGLRDSRVNPANWFGKSRSVEVEQGQIVNDDGEVVEVNPLIGERNQRKQQTSRVQQTNSTGGLAALFKRRNKEEGPYQGTLVSRVVELDVHRTSSGAIVEVMGLTSRQGAFDVRLIAANDGKPVDGVLTYELRALQPFQTAQGPERTREIRAAAALSTVELEDIRTIRVVARNNTQTSRR